jgi:hypothetical protein
MGTSRAIKTDELEGMGANWEEETEDQGGNTYKGTQWQAYSKQRRRNTECRAAEQNHRM